MEQIRFDPLSLLHTKRSSPQGTPQGSAAGDLFANLLGGKLKDADDVRPGAAPEPKADIASTRSRRAAYAPPRHAHPATPKDGADDAPDSRRLRVRDASDVHATRCSRATDDDTDELKTPVAADADAPGACVAAPTGGTAAATANSEAAPVGTPGNSGQSTGDAADGQTQPQPNPAEQVAEAAATPAVAPALVPGAAPRSDDAATSAASASDAISPEEAAAIAQVAVTAAATTLPEGVLGDAASSTPQAGTPAPAAPDIKAKNPAIAVNDNAAPEALVAAGADQVLAAGSTGAQPTQSAGAIFRQSSNSAKAKAQGPGQGAADPQAHQSNQTPQPKPLVAATAAVSEPLDQANRANGGGAMDSEFGTADQTGMGSWAPHLTPGIAGKNANFLANLRQQMQNLPVHEQVSIHIQRAIADRVGKLTVDLSPVELGRIQVKLKIDEDNRVSASVTVERPGTLDMLQRDSRALERALQEAGLKTDSGSLSFTLQGGETGDFDQDRGFAASSGTAKAADGAENTADTAGSARPSVIETADGLVDVEV